MFKRHLKSTQIKGLPAIPIMNDNPIILEKLPFPHVYIQNALKEEFYTVLCKYFNQVLLRGIVPSTEPLNPSKFQKFSYGYDASFWQPPPDIGYPINAFYEPIWVEFLSKLFNIPLTNHISLTLHHQVYDSKPFAAHNDYCLVGMSKCKGPSDKLQQYHFETPYFIKSVEEGQSLNLDIQMRSVVALFYINNLPWEEGKGGETALYEQYADYVAHKPFKKIPPISNSVLMFETTPETFHTYLPNFSKFRNTLIFWLHSDMKKKIAKYDGQLPTEYSYTRDAKKS